MKKKFPKLDSGWCDGIGCGKASVCYCQEWLASREEFQRIFKKPWVNSWDGDDKDCRTWEAAWRFGTDRWDKAWEKIVIRTPGSCIVKLK